jgi:hypothetical protein
VGTPADGRRRAPQTQGRRQGKGTGPNKEETMTATTIRRTDGTRPVVEHVYAFDPAQGITLVRLK